MLFRYVRSAYRSLLSARSYSLSAVLSLAIGIGGNLAIFTLANAVILRPLSYPKSEQLVLISQNSLKFGVGFKAPFGIIPVQFLRWRNGSHSFQSVAAAHIGTANLLQQGLPEKLGVMNITSEFFDTLRVRPQLGRWFRQADEARGSNAVAVLSDSLWRRRFAADPKVIGRDIKLAEGSVVVVGVAPPDLHLFRDRELSHWIEMPQQADLFRPLQFTNDEERGAPNPDYAVIARLKSGVTPTKAQAELEYSLAGIQYQMSPGGLEILVQPLQEVLVGGLRRLFFLLLGAAGMVLLIASVNAANLGLVRATRRSREFAIRAALGARRFDLMIEAIAESAILSAAATVLGMLLHVWITAMLLSLAPTRVPRLDEVSSDSSLVVFAVILFAITAILLGSVPVWRLAGTAPQEVLGAASRGNTSGPRDGRMRAILVGFEMALGTALLIVSGLVFTSFHRLITVPKGFDSQDVMTVRISLPESRYSTLEGQSRFCKKVLERLSQIPGIKNAAVASIPPLTFERNTAPALREGPGEEPENIVNWPRVSPTYFDLMHIALRDGRKFKETGETERVAMVSEAAARTLWPNQIPIGKRIAHGARPELFFRVIGVVDDIRASGLSSLATPAVYRLFEQRGGTEFSFMIRSARPAKSLASAVREAVWSVDTDVPVPGIVTMADMVNESVGEKHFQTILIGAFAITAILLAVFGIYAVVSQAVVERHKEIGLRIALGATSNGIRQFVFRHGMAPVSVGLFIGVAASAALTKLLSSMLFEVSPFDARTFIGAPVLLAAAAALPCFLIARAALRIDPLDALRTE